jgi:hypothetical protein
MFKFSHLLTAACLCTSAALFVSPVVADQLGSGAQPAGYASNEAGPNLIFPAGIQEKPMNEKNGISKSFAAVTEAAFSNDGFADVIATLVDQDRTRLVNAKENGVNESNDALSQKMQELKQAWKAKYNQDFDIKTDVVYDNFITFRTGEIVDPNQLVGKWPVTTYSGQKNTGGEASSEDINKTESKMFGGDVKLEKGRLVVLAEIPGANGAPALTVSMIHELGGWKFDIPNNITRQELHDALLRNLTYLYDHQDLWPSDVTEGYRQATRGVVAALYDADLNQLSNSVNGTANNR